MNCEMLSWSEPLLFLEGCLCCLSGSLFRQFLGLVLTLKKERDQYTKGKTDERRSHKQDGPGHGDAEKKEFSLYRLSILQDDNDTQQGQYGGGDQFKSFHG